MSGLLYYLLTFTESVTSVFGVRFPYEQPHFVVVQALPEDVQIRQYDPSEAIEVTVDGPDRDRAASQAFQLLFRYITGANQCEQKIAMTVPVHTESEWIAMTAPVQTNSEHGRVSMRFFLPKSVATSGAPAPSDSHVHLVQVPAETIAALRYSGVAKQTAFDRKSATLLRVLRSSPWKPDGAVYQLNYDPPFATPFLRRNEVAVMVTR